MPKFSGVLEKEEAIAQTSSKALVHVHFRRHDDWIKYMLAENDDDELLYGFDWLGDDDFDFGKTQDLIDKPYSSRYSYIENIAKSNDESKTEPSVILVPDMYRSQYSRSYLIDKTKSSGKDDNQLIKKLEEEMKIKEQKIEIKYERSHYSSTNGTQITNKTRDFLGGSVREYSSFDLGVGLSKKDIGDGKTNLESCIKDICREYGMDKIHGERYLCSYLNVRYNRPIKLKMGLRNLIETPIFGANEDKIILMPDENNFEITPNEITKADLDAGGGSVIIKIKNTNPLPKDAIIYAYHIDKNSKLKQDGTPLIKIMVGKLIVMKNDIYHEQYCYLANVKRSREAQQSAIARAASPNATSVEKFAGVEDDFSRYDSPEKIEKRLKRTMAQALIETIVIFGPKYDLVDFPKTWLSDKDLDENGKVIRKGDETLLILFTEHLKSLNIVPPKHANYIFQHGYYYNSAGYGELEPYPKKYKTPKEQQEFDEKRAKMGKVLMIFEPQRGNNTDTIVHEMGHTMGLSHSFLSEYGDKQQFKDGTKTKKDAVFFEKRAEDHEHVFEQGSTENIMDYTYGMTYKLGNFVYNETSEETTHSRYKFIKEKSESAFLFYEYLELRSNKHRGVSFWKWQWNVIRQDDELEKRKEILIKLD